ncbi:MAG: RDD family protein [Chlorobi bacterium]|nr:RDD family protein [Chlorobiota bacterium]
MENQDTNISEVNQQPVTYAGFWWRFLAAIIDWIVVGIAQQIVIMPFLGLLGISFFNASQNGGMMDEEGALLMLAAMIPMFGVSFFINWLYFALMESSKLRGTLGKMALSIRVTDMNGERVSFGRATGRYFGKILSAMIFMIGYIMAGFTAKKQALHDMLAGCLVIKE